MADPPVTAVSELRGAVEGAVAALAEGAPPRSAPTLERPKQAGHGDYATNAAMLLAPVMQASPREIAERLADELAVRLGPTLDRAEVAGPGFLNLFLADAWYADALATVLAAGDGYGGGGAEAPVRVNVEFVSVNPTGPLHVGHSRNAAYGDALARLLAFHGHAVHREYYVNDAGTQVRTFAASVAARARGEDPSDDGYQGAYVLGIADRIDGAATLPDEELVDAAVALMTADIRATLERFGVVMDTWFSERSLWPEKADRAFGVLRERGELYESDGALWARTTDFGDDKDRVVVRSGGEHTYFASDIAYHQDKRERGFELLIDVWGADHHGYVKRVEALYGALGGQPSELELLIMQLVHLRGARQSKRSGNIVTLDELLDDIGPDAARWFLVQRSHDTTMEMDLDLARSESADNPVYYVQYAHARIASIRRKAGPDAATSAALPVGARLHPSERQLVMRLLAFGDEVAEAADRRAVHRVPTYALATARDFMAFYRDCPVVGDELQAFRLALCAATQRVLARSLALIGCTAPVDM